MADSSLDSCGVSASPSPAPAATSGRRCCAQLTDPSLGVAEVRGLARRRPPRTSLPTPPSTGARSTSGSPARRGRHWRGLLDGVDAVVHLAWALPSGQAPRAAARGQRRRHLPGGPRGGAERGAARRPHVLARRVRGRRAGTAGPGGLAGRPASPAPSTAGTRATAAGRAAGCSAAGAAHPHDRRPSDAGAAAGCGERDRRLLPRSAAVRRRRAVRGAPWPRCCRSRCRPCGWASCTPTTSPMRWCGSSTGARPGRSNLAAEPTLGPADGLARALGTRRVPVPAFVLRGGADRGPRGPPGADRARLARGPRASAPQPLDTTRARTLLGWAPVHPGDDGAAPSS